MKRCAFLPIAALLAALAIAAPSWARQYDASESATGSVTIEQDGVQVTVSIKAQIYTWTITNIDAPPIMRFALPEHSTYNQNFPPGWRLQNEQGMFIASTDDERLAIHPGQTRTFDARSGSAGSMLGPVPLTLGFSADGADLVIDNVWAPIPKRRNIVVLVAGLMMFIGLVHVACIRRMERTARKG